MDYVGAALTSIGLLRDFWPSISKCFGYGKNLEKNRTALREQMERLKSRETDVKTELENAQYHRKRAREEVENWLKELQKMKDVVERMEKEVAKRRCFSRLRFLREWEENIERASELVKQSNFLHGILIDVKDEGMKLPTEELIGETTAKANLEKIWTWLEKGEAQSIGVCGMGGIGKTTLVTHMNNLLLEKKDTFGLVYWVTVSRDSSIRRLQDGIAQKIKLDLSEEQDEKIRQALLFEELLKMRKFVLIFDDMWEVYPAHEIGIPIGVDAGTLIITSRSREVCQKMGCQEIIKLDSLLEKEAWELFNKRLMRQGALSPREEEIAKDIVKECAGLPLAIVTTARSLSVAYDIAEWRNALIELREHVKGHTIDRENDVFKILEFSYHRLNNDKLRECLLYCALFPEDFKIRRMSLIKYWIVEGLIEEMGSRQAERDRGHAILNKLENACLLERCENGKAVKMHDVVRDMAINITRKNSQFLVKTRTNWEDLPGAMVWSSNWERVSVFHSKQSSLMMFQPKCPKLSTMFLRSCHLLSEDVPRSFFMHMAGLIVLDLSYTYLHFLPESVYDLVNLRALILCGCRKLKHVGSLAKLKELRMLDLSDTEIDTIPDGIEKLICLKQFNWTSNALQEIPRSQIFSLLGKSKESQREFLDSLPKVALSKILFNLVHLQCLNLLDERVRDLEAEELSRLTKLEILCTKFSSLHNFNSYIRTQHYCRLSHYYVDLVEQRTLRPRRTQLKRYCKQLRVMGLNLKERREDNDGYQLVLPGNLQALHLERCHLPASLWDVSPSLKKMMDLEECRIEHCTGAKYLCQVEVWIASLNTLYLQGLTSLRALFKQERTDIGRNCCWNLKHLEVRMCGNLKHLFTDGLVKYHLQNLVTLIVTHCNKMKGIIEAAAAKEEEEEEILCLPNLQRLELVSLPYLKSIWKGTMKCDTLQQLKVIECPKLIRLPIFVHVSAGDDDEERRPSNPPLARILGDEEWWNRVEWDTHPRAKSLFQPLFQHQPRYDTLRSRMSNPAEFPLTVRFTMNELLQERMTLPRADVEEHIFLKAPALWARRMKAMDKGKPCKFCDTDNRIALAVTLKKEQDNYYTMECRQLIQLMNIKIGDTVGFAYDTFHDNFKFKLTPASATRGEAAVGTH